MNFIISDSLINPPTSPLSFRDLTFWVAYERNRIDDILIEGDKENWDFYYKFLRSFGGFDYVSDFVKPADKEVGLRLSEEFRLAPTIQATFINEKNVFQILRAVSYNF